MKCRTIRSILLLAGFLVGSEQSAHAARSAAFPHADPGVRATAMGGAFSALGGIPSSVYWNPAGLYFQRGNTLEASYSSLYSLGRAKRSMVTAGFKRNVELPTFEGHTVHAFLDEETGPAYAAGIQSFVLDLEPEGYAETTITLGAAWGYGDNLITGVSGRFLLVSSDLEDVSANGYDLGLGIIWRFSNRERLALGVNHLISRVIWKFDRTERLPVSLVAGWARSWSNRLVTTAETELLENERSPYRLAAGAEWWAFPDRFTVRAGFRALRGDVDNVVGPTFGVGVRFAPMSLDYAYRVEPSSLDDTHRLGLFIQF